jgi:DNA-binding NarL/FixJ family response regulator
LAAESTQRARILVIDDDDAIRFLVRQTLEDAGYAVEAVSNGDDGVVAARRERPALVISDVQMPGTSGYEVCRRVRAECGGVGFMFLSGTRTEPYDRVAGFEFGADDYVTKPFDPDELVARVRAVLRRSAPSADISRAPNDYALTPRELEVLRSLAQGRTQAEIAGDLVLSPRTVGKHLERVLKKLGVHSRAEAIALAYRAGLVEDAAA